MSFEFHCPYCNGTFQAEDEWDGCEIFCPSCKKQIIIRRSSDVKDGAKDNVRQKAEEVLRKTFKLDKLEGFRLPRFLRKVFKLHSWKEIEEYLTLGTPGNTPSITEVKADWPTPWLFFWTMLLTIGLYLFLIWRSDFYGEGNILLPLLFVGIIGIPLASLLFFWEVNIPGNVSIISLVRIMVISGFVSIAVTVVFNKCLGHYGSVWAGPVEETAKLLTMMIFIRNVNYRYKLNGLLIGAAVGVGFAIIETGGYTLYSKAEGTMEVRALLAPFMHVAFSAIVGFALWRVKGQRAFAFSNLFNSKFISLFLLSIGLHMFWNSRLLGDELLIRTAVVGAIEYWIIIHLIQEGINEIKKVKADIGMGFGG